MTDPKSSAPAHKFVDALTAAGIDYSGLSWSGFNVFGDRPSVEEVKRLTHGTTRISQLEKALADAYLNRAGTMPSEEEIIDVLMKNYRRGWPPTARAVLALLRGSSPVNGPIPAVEIRPDDSGAIDEICARDVRCLHIEQMSADGWFMGIDGHDGSYWQFWFGSKNRKAAVEIRHTEMVPADEMASRTSG